MYNRYYGNSGRVERVGEHPRPAEPGPPKAAPPPVRPAPRRPRPPRGMPGPLRALERFLPGEREPLESDDLILLLILYLMYRESGDTELLLILGGLLIL